MYIIADINAVAHEVCHPDCHAVCIPDGLASADAFANDELFIIAAPHWLEISYLNKNKHPDCHSVGSEPVAACHLLKNVNAVDHCERAGDAERVPNGQPDADTLDDDDPQPVSDAIVDWEL